MLKTTEGLEAKHSDLSSCEERVRKFNRHTKVHVDVTRRLAMVEVQLDRVNALTEY